MDILADEIQHLWQLLEKHQVRCILVGGFATTLHGFNRFTADIDIWIKDSVDNRKRLRAVLNELDLGDFEAIETMQFLPGWSSIILNSGIELDIMTSLKGFNDREFDKCYEAATIADTGNATIRFLSLNDLIKEKKISDREKDRIDLIELEKIKKATGK